MLTPRNRSSLLKDVVKPSFTGRLFDCIRLDHSAQHVPKAGKLYIEIAKADELIDVLVSLAVFTEPRNFLVATGAA